MNRAISIVSSPSFIFAALVTVCCSLVIHRTLLDAPMCGNDNQSLCAMGESALPGSDGRLVRVEAPNGIVGDQSGRLVEVCLVVGRSGRWNRGGLRLTGGPGGVEVRIPEDRMGALGPLPCVGELWCVTGLPHGRKHHWVEVVSSSGLRRVDLAE